MYPNVRAEMARKNMTAVGLSEKTGIRYQTLTLKLNSKSDITIDEARRIKSALETDLPLEELFVEEVP